MPRGSCRRISLCGMIIKLACSKVTGITADIHWDSIESETLMWSQDWAQQSTDVWISLRPVTETLVQSKGWAQQPGDCGSQSCDYTRASPTVSCTRMAENLVCTHCCLRSQGPEIWGRFPDPGVPMWGGCQKPAHETGLNIQFLKVPVNRDSEIREPLPTPSVPTVRMYQGPCCRAPWKLMGKTNNLLGHEEPHGSLWCGTQMHFSPSPHWKWEARQALHQVRGSSAASQTRTLSQLMSSLWLSTLKTAGCSPIQGCTTQMSPCWHSAELTMKPRHAASIRLHHGAILWNIQFKAWWRLAMKISHIFYRIRLWLVSNFITLLIASVGGWVAIYGTINRWIVS